jgi:hypothetical protein
MFTGVLISLKETYYKVKGKEKTVRKNGCIRRETDGGKQAERSKR